MSAGLWKGGRHITKNALARFKGPPHLDDDDTHWWYDDEDEEEGCPVKDEERSAKAPARALEETSWSGARGFRVFQGASTSVQGFRSLSRYKHRKHSRKRSKHRKHSLKRAKRTKQPTPVNTI